MHFGPAQRSNFLEIGNFSTLLSDALKFGEVAHPLVDVDIDSVRKDKQIKNGAAVGGVCVIEQLNLDGSLGLIGWIGKVSDDLNCPCLTDPSFRPRVAGRLASQPSLMCYL